MISYIKGTLEEILEDKVVVENSGIGYEILVSSQVMSKMPLLGSDVKLYTYLYVREDVIMLYGFLTREELFVFKLLIAVSGIGPKGALGILSVISPADLRFAVETEDAKLITAAPGIGLKTAKKLIIELKDKIKSIPAVTNGIEIDNIQDESKIADKSDINDAVEALLALGYRKADALKAVKLAEKDLNGEMDVEKLLKQALKYLF